MKATAGLVEAQRRPARSKAVRRRQGSCGGLDVYGQASVEVEASAPTSPSDVGLDAGMTTTTTAAAAALTSSVGDGPPPSRSTTTITAGRTYHILKIEGYSSTLKAGRGQALRSSPFSAGGRTWYISYYPNGGRETNKHCISFFIHLDDDTVNDDVMAQVTFSLLDRHGNPVRSHTVTTTLYNFSVASSNALGFENFIRRDDLQRSEYLNDDCFAIAVRLVITEESPSFTVPPSNMHLDYGDLLSSKEGTDVEFVVGGETFAAHRLVLAARSPVFKAELFKPMEEGTTDVIKIDNMDAQVFKALLVFIYTDTWPEIGQDETTMVQQLLVAANKYSLSRLKIMCEDKLCSYIDTSSVVTMLMLADKYQCHGLKKVCFNFLASSRALSLVMKADNFWCLIQSHPTMLKDLIYNIVTHQLEIKLSV
uniref:BTB domain-containing protein n=2 Tax=Oryza TaxID=4527 RepID=A0A0E0QZG5_ORYRU